MKELFESYSKILNIINKDKSKEEDKNRIINNIQNYIIIFTEKSSGYLFNLLDILQNTPKKYFFEIILFVVKDINKCGKKCLEKGKDFCKYYCLIYFERVNILFNKYIINIKVIPLELKKNFKKEFEINLSYINDLTNGAVLLLEDSIKTGKLINIFSDILQKKNDFIFRLKEEKIKYEIILQNYEKILRGLNPNLEIDLNQKIFSKQFNIKEAICIANIVKINNYYLGNLNKRLLKLCERCEFIAKELDKKNEEWYKEFEDIYDHIKSYYSYLKENMIEERENIRNKYRNDFEEIERKFNIKKNNNEFIKFILNKYPYKGYEDDKKLNKIDYSKEQELLLYLNSKYQPDFNEFNGDEQTNKLYFIKELIDSYLKFMFENIQ